MAALNSESAIWNIQFAAGAILADQTVSRTVKRDLVQTLARFTVQACYANHGGAVLQLWESAQELFGLHPDDATIADVRELIFSELGRLLAVPSPCVQMAALHGLNHLEDPRATDLIASHDDQWFNDEVRSYSLTARSFTAP